MQRTLLSVCLLLAIALSCHAQGEKPKPNTLTPKEIADGWILLFDGETTFGWQFKGKAGLAHSTLLLSGEDATATPAIPWANHELLFEYRVQKPNARFFDAQLALDGSSSGIGLPRETGDWIQARLTNELDAKRGLPTVTLTTTVKGVEVGHSKCVGGQWAKFSHRWYGPRGSDLELRNIKLRPLNAKSIFNDKDLTGWKEFPGKKSKFTVEDGAITVKDGPGDLQTLGKYQDFVLQLECISNGKHLNSGIFFRCKDNEYQNGYEAQIFNKFTKEPTQDYTVEEFDPKTNKLLAKNKVKSTAVDFGTGAIYRRVPARKEMSKDGEWFGMTIVAHGNHIATWVNGVQVTDWTDNRPKSDNPRTGCRLEAGHISIQGHDPTTNLSFRNFRIAELPAGK